MKTFVRLKGDSRGSLNGPAAKRAARAKRALDHDSSRRGAAMIFALIALLVASIIIGSLLKTAGMSHRQLKKDENRLQASLLADAGCDRIRMLLQTQADFTSGEWNVSAEQFGSGRSGQVQMTVATDPNNPDRRIIMAVAHYPVGQPDAVRITRQISIR